MLVCRGVYFHNYRVFSGYTWNVDLIQQQRIKSYKKPIGVGFLVFATNAQGRAISIGFLIRADKIGKSSSG